MRVDAKGDVGRSVPQLKTKKAFAPERSAETHAQAVSVPEPFQRSKIGAYASSLAPYHIADLQRFFRVERAGIEPATSGLQSRESRATPDDA